MESSKDTNGEKEVYKKLFTKSAGSKRKTPELRRTRSKSLETDSGSPSRPLPSAEAFQPFSEKKRNTPVFGTPVPQTPFKRPASHDSKSIKQLENQLLDIFPIEDGKDQWELMKSTKTSTIYKVREKLSNKLFVLKKLNPKVVGKYNDKRKECIHGKNLNHFNLVKYYEFWKVPSVIYFKIEYCPGGSLEDYLIRNSLEGNPTEKPELWNFFLDLALGLQYIHVNGYVHLDIKPGRDQFH
eukprot:TRINITY_DN1302_c0_g1_i2.p1 TRINITY_DN1302_c0_g1~~TRINITY_DN1302_c0_g1_i2.p1  ORF type:complete len:240 (+),score=50.65 TRINITY_DN1302_c0_g1_i2:61-780(+)